MDGSRHRFMHVYLGELLPFALLKLLEQLLVIDPELLGTYTQTALHIVYRYVHRLVLTCVQAWE